MKSLNLLAVLFTALILSFFSCTKPGTEDSGVINTWPFKLHSALTITINSTATSSHTISLKGISTTTGSVDWGDATSNNFSSSGTATVTHTYATPGVYTVTIGLTSPTADITDFTSSIAQITAVSGLGNLPNLKTINLHHNQLTTLDLTSNPELTEISLYNNSLTSINVTNNIKLVTLSASFNNISSIDLTHNTNLFLLSIPKNQLTTVDLSHNSALLKVSVENNNLPVAAINKALTDLDALGLHNGTFASFYQSPPAPPSGAGATALLNLQNKGWVNTTD
jgi:hypothetical protein